MTTYHNKDERKLQFWMLATFGTVPAALLLGGLIRTAITGFGWNVYTSLTFFVVYAGFSVIAGVTAIPSLFLKGISKKAMGAGLAGMAIILIPFLADLSQMNASGFLWSLADVLSTGILAAIGVALAAHLVAHRRPTP